jgi:F420-dependent oxidoreductase-like protein
MLRLGFQLPRFTFSNVPDNRLFDHVISIACVAEESGFDSFFVMDHFQQIGMMGPPEEPMPEAYTLLSSIAACTSHIKLGALVTGAVYRNPALLAKMVTTLDVISKGRAILGIGAAWNEDEASRMGYDWPSTGERLDRLEDTVRICRAMFQEQSATVEGKYHSVHNALNKPRPIQPGGPKIMLGGGGERRTLRLVAEYADACNVFGSVEDVRHKMSVLDQHCREVGRDPAQITRTRLGTIVFGSSQEEASQRFETMFASAAPDARQRYRAMIHLGDAASICDQIQPYFDAGLDGMIFNMMRNARPEEVRQLGQALSQRFGAQPPVGTGAI